MSIEQLEQDSKTGHGADASVLSQSSLGEMVQCQHCLKLFKSRGIATHKRACKGSRITAKPKNEPKPNLERQFCSKPVKNNTGLRSHENTCPKRTVTSTHVCCCGLELDSLISLQLHRPHTQESEYFSEQQRSKRPRWTEAKTETLVKLNAEHNIKCTKFINVAINTETNWSIEAIKKRRQIFKSEKEAKILSLTESVTKNLNHQIRLKKP